MFWFLILLCVLVGSLGFADDSTVVADSSTGDDESDSFGVSDADASMDEIVVEDIPDESDASKGTADDSIADETPSDDVNVTQTAQDSGFDPALVDHARRFYSMTDDEIARYGTSERLHAALDGMYQQQLKQAAPENKGDELEEKEKALKVLLESEGDDPFDDRLVDQIRMMVDEINALKEEVKQGNEKIQQAEQAAVAQQVSAAEAQIDNYIDEVSEEFPGFFGKGSTVKMPPNSKERQNRVELFNRAVALANVLQNQPGGLPSEKEILRQAAYSIFGPKLHEGAAENNGRSGVYGSQHVNRPTNRSSKNDAEDAAAFADRFMREKGFDPGDYDEDIGL